MATKKVSLLEMTLFINYNFSLIKIRDYMLSPSSFAIEAKWHSVKRIGELAFDHNKIFASCKAHLVQCVQS